MTKVGMNYEGQDTQYSYELQKSRSLDQKKTPFIKVRMNYEGVKDPPSFPPSLNCVCVDVRRGGATLAVTTKVGRPSTALPALAHFRSVGVLKLNNQTKQ